MLVEQCHKQAMCHGWEWFIASLKESFPSYRGTPDGWFITNGNPSKIDYLGGPPFVGHI